MFWSSLAYSTLPETPRDPRLASSLRYKFPLLSCQWIISVFSVSLPTSNMKVHLLGAFCDLNHLP